VAETKTRGDLAKVSAENTRLRTTLARVQKVLEVSRDLNSKQTDLLEELDNLLGGRASIGDKLKALEAAFDAAWCERYAPGTTGRYVWNYAQDRSNSKRLLKSIEVEDLAARALRFVRSDDPFFVKARHGFSLFVRTVNQWAPEAAAPEDLELDSPTVGDCKHTPRCKDDATHTRRKVADMRATA
jgi:hypothetical protein